MKVDELNQLLEKLSCDAAELLGVKKSTLHRWVTGKKPIPDHYINILKKERNHVEGNEGGA
jgi:plasmid maintenance system antidote protein VapI